MDQTFPASQVADEETVSGGFQGCESELPYFGWLSSSVPGYPETLKLETMVHTRAVGVRPRIELEPTDHPLAVEQREGITRERVREIAEIVLHGGS